MGNKNIIKYWKPNWFQRLGYWIGVQKDPRYNGDKTSCIELDQIGTTDIKHRRHINN